jgi:hypothetical protein
MAKAKTKKKDVSFKTTLKTIVKQLLESPNHQSELAIEISNAIKRARGPVPVPPNQPLEANPTELLSLFQPTGDELNKMGLDDKFLDYRCSNHTALYMADFTRFARRWRAKKKKGKKSRLKK